MARLLMAIDGEGRHGTGDDHKRTERTNSREGYRELAWQSRIGTVWL